MHFQEHIRLGMYRKSVALKYCTESILFKRIQKFTLGAKSANFSEITF